MNNIEEGKSVNLPKKYQFKLCPKENGSCLTIHNTVEENKNKIRIPFKLATFTDNNTHLITIDHRGNVFAFDFTSNEYWKMFSQIPNCTAICNIPDDDYSKCIISTKTGKIYLINIELGIVQKIKKISLHCIDGISIIPKTSSSSSSSIKNQFCIYSTQEALICNWRTFKAICRLEFDDNKYHLKYLSYIPNNDKILICFTNDIIHISSYNNFKIIKILYPNKIRDRYMNKNKNKYSNSNDKNFIQNDELCIPSSDSDSHLEMLNDMLSSDEMIINDLTKGNITSIKISSDGRLICLSFIDNIIMVLTVGDYEVLKMIKLNDIKCKEINFLRNIEIIIFALTTTSDIILIGCDNSKIKFAINDKKSYKFGISKNGQMLFRILTTGKIEMYKISTIFNLLKSNTEKCSNDTVENTTKLNNICKQKIDENISNFKFQKYLAKNRLFPILREYGEFPEKYRHLIWINILDLPENRKVFLELIKKGIHSSVKCYDEKYSNKDHITLRNLKKIVSCLLHWCTALQYCDDYISDFVLPFMTIFPNNILLTFELIVTLLINYCQLWFEFIPIEPINYIGIIENILNEFDKELFEFYVKNDVTGKIYAWELMKTAFSNVLDKKKWLQLWDNIILNETYFMIFCIVSFNITQKKIIMKISNPDEIKDYFHQHNHHINMKIFLNRAYTLMEKCPNIIHPNRYIKIYEKLPKGYYPKLENYPKNWIKATNYETEMIKIEENDFIEKLRELEFEEDNLLKDLEEQLKTEEQEKRIKELEKVYEHTIQSEQEKIMTQRQILLLYQKEIRQRKAQALKLRIESANRQNINLHENEFDTMQKTLTKTGARNEMDMMFADDELKNQEFHILEQKSRQKMISMYNQESSIDDHLKDSLKCFENEFYRLTNEYKNLTKNQYGNSSTSDSTDQLHDDIKYEIDNMEKMFEHVKSEVFNVIHNESKTNKMNKLKKLDLRIIELKQEVMEMIYNIKKL